MIGLNRADSILTTIWNILQESGDFTWRVTDCEELEGVNCRRLKLLNSTEYHGLLTPIWTPKYNKLNSQIYYIIT